MKRRDPLTIDLFEVPQPAAPLPASMDYRAQVSALVSDMLKKTDLDRFAIAAQCSRLSGTEVSKYMLDAYASEAREAYNIPFWMVPILEEACQSHDLTNWLVGVRGGRLYLGKDVLHAELGKLEKERDENARLIKELKKRMGE